MNALKKQSTFYSGKKCTHTLKFQLVIDQASGAILQWAVAQANEHDITLARQQLKPLPQGTLCAVDLAYQGLTLEGCEVVWPFKKPKKRALEPEEKAFNRRLAQVRVKVEHRIRTLKIFRLLKGVYRGSRRRFELRLRLIAGLVNRMIPAT